MKPFNRRSVVGWGGFFLMGFLPMMLAETKPNPYQAIVERNPFGLKPPPPPPDPTPVAPVIPPGKVILTGITSMFGPSPRALLEITEQEPGKPAAVRKPILREGERDGAIEVISIDVEKSVVKIRNAGLEANIAFETAKLTPSTAPPIVPGFPPPPLTTAIPNAASPPNPNAPRSSGVTIVGGGAPATAAPPNGFPGAPVPGAYPPAGTPAFGAGGLRQIPSRSLRTDGAIITSPPVPGDPPKQYR